VGKPQILINKRNIEQSMRVTNSMDRALLEKLLS
jgi:hypothetical protein